MFNEINCKKSQITNTVSREKTLKTIHQLSCFEGHSVCRMCVYRLINVYSIFNLKRFIVFLNCRTDYTDMTKGYSFIKGHTFYFDVYAHLHSLTQIIFVHWTYVHCHGACTVNVKNQMSAPCVLSAQTHFTFTFR